jgi:carnitine O-acetyltransferase
MLASQAELERLPVPDLVETCALYLELVRPLVSGAELAGTRRAVSEFVTPGGPGRALQRRLLDWSATRDNWLEPFWDDWYLCDETPLLINVSPGFVLAGTGCRQSSRAAGLLAAALRFKELVDRQELEPDVENGRPRCMREYSRVLSSTRIPGTTRDRLESYPESRHVVVSRGGRLYALDVLDEAGSSYSVAELERALHNIVDDSRVAEVPLGALTAGDRRGWAGIREEHLRNGSPSTRATLQAVESAILLLVLHGGRAPQVPRSSKAARMALHGVVSERWFDKSIQLVVAENGVAGFCMEHAGFDGRTALRFAEFLVDNESRRGTGMRAPDGYVARPLAVEPTTGLLAATELGRNGAEALVARTHLVLLDFQRFGKKTIAGHGLSPDGFVQMAFQVAYHSLTGEVASTYESVDTKRFLHGRTEAMRCVSDESVAFVHSLRGRVARPAAAVESLRAAVARHTALVRRSQEGRGVDRHLLGLRRMLEPSERVPALFADSSYTNLMRSVLSTSSTRSSAGAELACFGPVVDEGFGVSYTIRDDEISVVVTNFHGLARVFAEELERALLDMSRLLAD